MNRNQDHNLERVLEAAVVLSWKDLMRGAKDALVHLEYNFAANGTLDHVQIWSSTVRGYWLLACSYWMAASKLHESGVHFDNGFESKTLSQVLDAVMQHQNIFNLPPNLGRLGLLQITTPTDGDRTAAASALSGVLRSC